MTGTCAPLLLEDGTFFITETDDNICLVLEISNDCSIEFGTSTQKAGGGSNVQSQHYTPIGERKIWMKVRFKDKEWDAEVELPNFAFPHSNPKVAAMFKPDARHQRIVEETTKNTIRRIVNEIDNKVKKKRK